MTEDISVSRRRVLVGGIATATVAAVPPVEAQLRPGAPMPTMSVYFTVNGECRELSVDPRTTLLDALRASASDRNKEGLGPWPVRRMHRAGRRQAYQFVPDARGDARRRYGYDNRRARHTGQAAPYGAALVKHDGYQCGYCTPGQICSAVAVLDEIKRGIPSHVQGEVASRPRAAGVEMRERMSGNICRCGAYSNIADAMADVAGEQT